MFFFLALTGVKQPRIIYNTTQHNIDNMNIIFSDIHNPLYAVTLNVRLAFRQLKFDLGMVIGVVNESAVPQSAI